MSVEKNQNFEKHKDIYLCIYQSKKTGFQQIGKVPTLPF